MLVHLLRFSFLFCREFLGGQAVWAAHALRTKLCFSMSSLIEVLLCFLLEASLSVHTWLEAGLLCV